MALPVLDEVAREQGIDVIYYLNIEEYDFSKNQAQFGIQGVPTVLKIEGGEKVASSQDEEYQPLELDVEGLSDEDAYRKYYRVVYTTMIKDNAN